MEIARGQSAALLRCILRWKGLLQKSDTCLLAEQSKITTWRRDPLRTHPSLQLNWQEAAAQAAMMEELRSWQSLVSLWDRMEDRRLHMHEAPSTFELGTPVSTALRVPKGQCHAARRPHPPDRFGA